MGVSSSIWSSEKLPLLGNDRRSKAARAALAKKQRANAHRLCLASLPLFWKARRPRRVELVRHFWHPARETDSDNLVASFKHIRDGIADYFGIDDSPRSGVEWIYRQVELCGDKKNGWSARIELLDEIEAVPRPPPFPKVLPAADALREYRRLREELRAAQERVTEARSRLSTDDLLMVCREEHP